MHRCVTSGGDTPVVTFITPGENESPAQQRQDDIESILIGEAGSVPANRVAEDSKISMSLCPETLHAWSMWVFIVGVLVSAILTFGFTKPDLTQDPILRVYGAVNACIAFDYQPARSLFAVRLLFA